MSDTPKNDPPAPHKKKYILEEKRKRIVVHADEFYGDGQDFKASEILQRPLSEKMERIYKIISATAIDRLNKQGFIKFYNNDKLEKFHGAMLSRIYSPDEGRGNDDNENDAKAIGFLFASFYSRTKKIITDEGLKSETIYIGMAFPGIKFEERTKLKDRAEWNRQDFYKMFLGFYAEQIFLALKTEVNDEECYKNNFLSREKRICDYNITRTPPTNNEYQEDVKWVITILKEGKVKKDDYSELAKDILIPRMQIEAYAENPITYNDFCEFHFTYNVKPPSEEFIKMSEHWSVADLLHYSYIESNNPNPPVFLKKGLDFTVNLTPLEWRKYFEIAINWKKPPMIYYLWQNFNFPNTAFKVTIPLNAENFWKVVKGVNQKSPESPSAFGKKFDDEIDKILKS